jgi:ApaG protein
METFTTDGITVIVRSQYMAGHSSPAENRFLFSYFITIENSSKDTVQLMARRWTIKDAKLIIREVFGDGVIGQQPVIPPGSSYSYSSYCDISSDMGKMLGTYTMMHCGDGTYFEVTIPEFKLIAPFRLN